MSDWEIVVDSFKDAGFPLGFVCGIFTAFIILILMARNDR